MHNPYKVQYVSLVFQCLTGSSKRDASMLSRLKIYQDFGPIKDTRVVVVLRTGNTGIPTVPPCLSVEKDVGQCSHIFKLDTVG